MEEKRTEISSLGEFGLIERLVAPFGKNQTSTVKAVGDDAAVLRYGAEDLLISTDVLVEGVHFDLMYSPLRHLGYKSVVVNLSDIYAMNGIPKQITVSIAISNRFSVEALEEFYDGIRLACKKYGVDLIGGDTSSSNKGFIISVTAIGSAAPEKIAYRSGAKEGDLICVSGDLGAAYCGLQLLEREKKIFLEHPEIKPELEPYEYMVGRILKPEARKDVVEKMDEIGLVPTSMIDISDGLSSDLLHICKQSNLAAHLFELNIPIAQETYELATTFQLNPLICALNGGEDYELLFTIRSEDEGLMSQLPQASIIGYMTAADKGNWIETSSGQLLPVKAQGWNHAN